MTNTTSKAAIIAEQNDRFRTSGPSENVPGQVVCTQGISMLSPERQIEIIAKTQQFNGFTEDNDPHGEHDFGSFEVAGVGKIFWKMDYYDTNYRYGSEDPSDPEQTCRVLTVMLAEEY